MNHNVDKSLNTLLCEISTLVPLENNPRHGNVDAIVSSYREFGQLKPIVARPNPDGTATVIAGNHQLEAAKKLGWTHIAVVKYEADDARAVAFALTDNRTNELGYTEASSLNSAIQEIWTDYPDLLEDLGWDAFEMAAISEQALRIDRASEEDAGYTAPVIINPFDNSAKIAVEETEDGSRLVPASDVDNRKLASTGSTLIGASGIRNAIVQYSLVFDSVEQQSQWYSFIRWLKTEPSIDGDTTAERLINFIDAHADYR